MTGVQTCALPISLFVKGNSIAETWEKALVELWNNGISMPTQYDVDPHTGFKHPPSKDCMMTMVVENALAEPRLHCCLEGGPAELAEYKLESLMVLRITGLNKIQKTQNGLILILIDYLIGEVN